MLQLQISKDGLSQLKKRLISLQKEHTKLRIKLVDIRKTKQADEFDLLDATTRLALLEKQIAETSHLLAHSTNQFSAPSDGTVQLGSTVRLKTPWGVMNCKIVNAIEADPAKGKISDASPLGSALLGKASRAWVKIKGPRRSFSYQVLGVRAT